MLQPTRLISTPFAQEGEKTEIQNVTGEFDNSATYQLGFPPLTMQSIRSGGKPPKGTDFNGVLFDITENISFLCKGGRYQYNAGLSTLIGGYPKGSNLLLDDNVTEVVSTVAENQNNPNTNMAGWILKPNKTTAVNVADASGETQQQVNYNGGSKWHSRVGGYKENERVVLTNGDIVKSTIDGNTNDPNVNMTGWKNQIKQLEDRGSYSNSYSSIQSAIDSFSTRGELNIVSGEYTESLTVSAPDLIGQGYSTVLNVAENTTGITILDSSPQWDRRRIENLTVQATSRNGTIGVSFDPNNSSAGRRNLNYVAFHGLGIAIQRPKGNIGNAYNYLDVSNCDYAYVAKSVTGENLMHSGNDVFNNCQFDNIDVWAIDLENTTYGFGQFSVKDSIIEFCQGGGIRLDLGGMTPFVPPVIRNVWFENVAMADTVTRKGVTENPREIKLINAPMVIIEECYLKNIELINSTAVARSCRIDNDNSNQLPKIIIDDNSQLILEDAYLDGYAHPSAIFKSIAKQTKQLPQALTLRGQAISGITKKPYNAFSAIGLPYFGTAGISNWYIPGTQNVVANCVYDDGIKGTCAELNLTNGIVNVVGITSLIAGKWAVWGISAKSVSGVSGVFKFKNESYEIGDIYLQEGKWVHSFGVAKVETSGSVSAWLQPSQSGVIRFANYFVVQFNTEAEAIAFANSRMAVDTVVRELSVNYNPPSLPAGDITTTTITLAGARLGENVSVSFNKSLQGVFMWADVLGYDTIMVYIKNLNTSIVDLESGLLTVRIN